MSMRRVFLISAGVHIGLLIVLPVLPSLGNEQPLALETYTVELVDLPEETRPTEENTVEPEPESEQKSVEPEPEVEIPEEPVKRARPKVVTPPPRPPQKSLEERIKERLEAQEKSRPPEEAEPSEKRERPPAQSTRITAGKVADYYLTMLQGKITRNWKQPSARFTGGEALTVRVSFRVLRSGDVAALNVARTSGWTTVDQSALQAVRASAPFAPLPDTYKDAHLDVTIDFTVTP